MAAKAQKWVNTCLLYTSVVTNDLLKELGMVKNKYEFVKVLGEGEIKVPLTVKVNKVSKSAKEKIEAAGGKVEVL